MFIDRGARISRRPGEDGDAVLLTVFVAVRRVFLYCKKPAVNSPGDYIIMISDLSIKFFVCSIIINSSFAAFSVQFPL